MSAASAVVLAGCGHTRPRAPSPAPPSAIAVDTEVARGLSASVCLPAADPAGAALGSAPARGVLTRTRLAELASAARAGPRAERARLEAVHRVLAAAYVRRAAAGAEAGMRRALETPVVSGDMTTKLAGLVEALGSTAPAADRAALLAAARPGLALLASSTASELPVSLAAARELGVSPATLASTAIAAPAVERAVRVLGSSASLYLGLAGDAATKLGESRTIAEADLPRLLRAGTRPEEDRLAAALGAVAREAGVSLATSDAADPPSAYARSAALCGDRLTPCGQQLAALVLGGLGANPAWLAEQGLGRPRARVERAALGWLALVRRDAALVSAADDAERALSGQAALEALARRLSDAYGTTIDGGFAALVATHAGPAFCAAPRLEAALAAGALERRLAAEGGERWWHSEPALALLRRVAIATYPDELGAADQPVAGDPGEHALVDSLARAIVDAELAEGAE